MSDFVNVEIPASLRPISLFLHEAQKGLRGHLCTNDEDTSLRYKRITLCAINHAFKLMDATEIHLDDVAQLCLNRFRSIQTQLTTDLVQENPIHSRFCSIQKFKIVASTAEDVLVAEAIEVMEFADEQWEVGMRTEACRNYHAAAVYIRVLQSAVPNIQSELRQRLQYAVTRLRHCSSLQQNLVREHFWGSSCAQFYDVHGRNKLGKGSYGSVYLATHRITGDNRAVKVMNVDRVTSYYLKKLHTEIDILREVDHPNIIKLQEVFFGRRSVYLVTNLCRGGALFDLLASGKNQGYVFREDRASCLMKDMISSVKYLHSLGIVHRDLKLENFLFEGVSCNSPLILIDFGLSRRFDQTEKISQRVGSCYYTAPEVLSGAYDHRCDLWSLGVICYMLLSGSPPFYGKTPDEIHKSILTKEADFPDRKFKHVSQQGIDFMRRLLTKDPDHRMTGTDALRHAFITGMFSPSSTRKASPGHIVLADPLLKSADKIAQSLRLYASLPLLTKLVVGLVARSLSPDQLSPFRFEFSNLDQDNSGTISLPEIQALGSSGQAQDFAELYRNITFLRLPGGMSGDIPLDAIPEMTYGEYISAAVCGRFNITRDRVQLAFKNLDGEQQGIISADTISRVMGMDINCDAFQQDIMSVKAHFADSGATNGLMDGIDELTFFKCWYAVGVGQSESVLHDDSSSMEEASLDSWGASSLSTVGS